MDKITVNKFEIQYAGSQHSHIQDTACLSKYEQNDLLPTEIVLCQLDDDGHIERREPDGQVSEELIKRDIRGNFENLRIKREIIFVSSEDCNFYKEGMTFGAYQEPEEGDLYFKVFGGYCFYRQGLNTPTGREHPMGAWCLIGTKEELLLFMSKYSDSLNISNANYFIEIIKTFDIRR